MAIQEVTIATPPSQLFQGISSNYLDNMTYEEFLLGILKKMNEVIAQVNADEKFIETFEKQYGVLLAEFEALKEELEGLDTRINNEVDVKLDEFRQELRDAITATTNYLIAYSDAGDARLEAEIQAIQIGDIQLIDPTTGLLSPIQTVVNNIAGSGANALTATEYDALELTATAFDAYDITAYEYDFNGKAVLV